MSQPQSKKETKEMDNVSVKINGSKLVIEVDMKKSIGISSSGKNTLVASTKGNYAVPGTDLKVGLNVYKPVNGKA